MILRNIVPAFAFSALGLMMATGCGSSRSTTSSDFDINEYLQEAVTSDEFDASEESPYTADQYHGSYDRTFDLLHTELRVSFDWPKAQMKGDATLTLKPYFYASNQVTLDARGFDINRVEMVNADGGYSTLKYQYDQAKLKVNLGR